MTATTSELDTTTGDVAAALEAAKPHAQVLEHKADASVLVVAQRDDHTVSYEDLERYLPAPARARGTVKAFTADGFVEAFRTRVWPEEAAAVYADSDECRLIGVLNDDDGDVHGWRDHRVELQLKTTPEWDHWVGHQGLKPQAVFAEVIEAGQDEIVGDPSAVVMLEVAQQFEASVGGKFRQQSRLRDGTVQFVWEETVDAKVGDGLVDVPQSFTVSLRPFYGAEPREIEARIRYTCRGGELRIGYVLHRPEEVKRDAFAADVVDHVHEQLADHPMIEGTPAGPTPVGR